MRLRKREGELWGGRRRERGDKRKREREEGCERERESRKTDRQTENLDQSPTETPEIHNRIRK